MRKSWILVVSIALAFSAMASAQAISLADCIAVSSGQYKKGFLGSSYEVTVVNACGDNAKELLNYTSLSFYAGNSVLNPETDTIFYLQSYGQNFSFKLRNLKPGKYSPYLKIWSPKDYSSRTVYLPGFSIADPLNCLAVSESEFLNSKFDPLLRISIKNDCSDLESSAFSGFQFNLSLPGYFPYISSKSLYSISSYGTSLEFSLRDIKSGSYFPTLEIKDSNYQTRKIPLGVFNVSSAPTPAQTPKKSSASGNTASLTQVCTTSKEFDEQCSDYPDFSLEFCSSLQKASLQEKVGAKWVYLWTVTGTRDSSTCSDPKYPFYIVASGENQTGNKTFMRLVFTKTTKISSYTQNFTLVFR